MSLLDKAKSFKDRRIKHEQITEEEIVLAVSLAKNEVSYRQARYALSLTHSGAAFRLMSALRLGVEMGKVSISLNDPLP